MLAWGRGRWAVPQKPKIDEISLHLNDDNDNNDNRAIYTRKNKINKSRTVPFIRACLI